MITQAQSSAEQALVCEVRSHVLSSPACHYSCFRHRGYACNSEIWLKKFENSTNWKFGSRIRRVPQFRSLHAHSSLRAVFAAHTAIKSHTQLSRHDTHKTKTPFLYLRSTHQHAFQGTGPGRQRECICLQQQLIIFNHDAVLQPQRRAAKHCVHTCPDQHACPFRDCVRTTHRTAMCACRRLCTCSQCDTHTKRAGSVGLRCSRLFVRTNPNSPRPCHLLLTDDGHTEGEGGRSAGQRADAG